MNRELTGREKVMLLILIVLVMALGYYKLIFEPINDQVAAYRDSTEQEQTELTTELVRAEQMKKMESAVAELRQRGDVKPIPAYDNSKALMVELHRILASAQEYSLDFSAGTTEEDYIPELYHSDLHSKPRHFRRAERQRLHEQDLRSEHSDGNGKGRERR